jgi:hypothetical protein
MLLDKYVLTEGLTNLLSHSPTSTGPSATFTKRVNSMLARLDPLLKTLQVRPSPPEGLVQAYLIHIGDKSETNFRKILELKGVKKQEQAHLVELFTIHRDGPRNGSADLVAQSPLLTPLTVGGEGKGIVGLGLGGGNSSAAPAMGISSARTFDFGEKLFSAARDGVERIGQGTGSGSPNLGGQEARRDASAEREGGMNENLRNIGKFFRRDLSGLGRFGRKEGSEEAGK